MATGQSVELDKTHLITNSLLSQVNQLAPILQVDLGGKPITTIDGVRRVYDIVVSQGSANIVPRTQLELTMIQMAQSRGEPLPLVINASGDLVFDFNAFANSFSANQQIPESVRTLDSAREIANKVKTSRTKLGLGSSAETLKKFDVDPVLWCAAYFQRFYDLRKIEAMNEQAFKVQFRTDKPATRSELVEFLSTELANNILRISLAIDEGHPYDSSGDDKERIEEYIKNNMATRDDLVLMLKSALATTALYQ